MLDFLGSIFSANQAYRGVGDTNRANMDMFHEGNEFSAQQFASRYQTTTKDMQAAGLNPMLAYSQGGGTPPTTASPPRMENSRGAAIQAGLQSYSAYNANELIKAQTRVENAKADNVEADTTVKRATPILMDLQGKSYIGSATQAQASVNFMEHQSEKIRLELNNVPKEGNRLDALADQLLASKVLMQQQNNTQVQMTAQIKELARKAIADANLTELDLKAANSFNNFGRNSKELSAIFDIIRPLLTGRSR